MTPGEIAMAIAMGVLLIAGGYAIAYRAGRNREREREPSEAALFAGHADADAVAHVFTQDAVSVWLDIAFHRMSDVAYSIPYNCLFDACEKRTFRGLNELEVFLVCVSYWNGDTGITHVTIQFYHKIERNSITFF